MVEIGRVEQLIADIAAYAAHPVAMAVAGEIDSATPSTDVMDRVRERHLDTSAARNLLQQHVETTKQIDTILTAESREQLELVLATWAQGSESKRESLVALLALSTQKYWLIPAIAIARDGDERLGKILDAILNYLAALETSGQVAAVIIAPDPPTFSVSAGAFDDDLMISNRKRTVREHAASAWGNMRRNTVRRMRGTRNDSEWSTTEPPSVRPPTVPPSPPMAAQPPAASPPDAAVAASADAIPVPSHPASPSFPPAPTDELDEPASARPARQFRAFLDSTRADVVGLEVSSQQPEGTEALSFIGRTVSAEVLSGQRTRWLVTSDEKLTTVDNTCELVVDGPAWVVEFFLDIPDDEDSATRYVKCLGSGATQLLDITVSVVDDAMPAMHYEAVVPLATSTSTDTIVTTNPLRGASLSEHANRPRHDFTKPPASITFTVMGADRVSVDVQHDHKQVFSDKWPGTAEVATRVAILRKAADDFRADHTGYLDAIDPASLRQELDRDLASGALGSTANWADSEALGTPDATATNAWNAAAGSTQAFDLAFAGYRLYQQFFPDGTSLRSQMDALPAGSLMVIHWLLKDGIESLPWGMMYTDEPQAGVPIDATKFVGLRFRVYWAKWPSSARSIYLGAADEVEKLSALYWGDGKVGDESALQQQALANRNYVVLPDESVAGAPHDQVITTMGANPNAAILYFYCEWSPDRRAFLFNRLNQPDAELSIDHVGAGRLPNQTARIHERLRNL